MSAPTQKSHHIRSEVCGSRPRYREGRDPKAIKVYTVSAESRYLLVQGIPALGAEQELIKLFGVYGPIEEHRVLHEYPTEEFTEVYLIVFHKTQSARIAKKKLDDFSFFGGVLHICYAPEYETLDDARNKLQERRRAVAKRLKELEAERPRKKKVLSDDSLSHQHDQAEADERFEGQESSTGILASHSEKVTAQWNTEGTELNRCTNTSGGLRDSQVPPRPTQRSQQRPCFGRSPFERPPLHMLQRPPFQRPPLQRPPPNQPPFQGPYQPCTSSDGQPIYPPPLPSLPPPPQHLMPWQLPRPRPQFDHARVPSAHATLPQWMQEPPPWHDQESYSETRPNPDQTFDRTELNVHATETSINLVHNHEQQQPVSQPPVNSRVEPFKGKFLPRNVQKNVLKNSAEKSDVAQSSSTSSETLIIREYKVKGPKPSFIPRQVSKKRDILKKHVLDSKVEFRRTIKDTINENLRKNAFILDNIKGPMLPDAEEKKRKLFKETETGSTSLDDTLHNIRKKSSSFRQLYQYRTPRNRRRDDTVTIISQN